MVRVIYNIRCRDKEAGVKVKQVEGYTFQVGELKFGVTNTSPLPENRKHDVWTVTELSTGYSCAVAGKKSEAIDYVLKGDILEKVKMGIEAAGTEDINTDIIASTIYYPQYK